MLVVQVLRIVLQIIIWYRLHPAVPTAAVAVAAAAPAVDTSAASAADLGKGGTYEPDDLTDMSGRHAARALLHWFAGVDGERWVRLSPSCAEAHERSESWFRVGFSRDDC